MSLWRAEVTLGISWCVATQWRDEPLLYSPVLMCFLGVLLSSVFHTSFWIFLFAIITSFSNYQCGGLVEVMAHIYLFHGHCITFLLLSIFMNSHLCFQWSSPSANNLCFRAGNLQRGKGEGWKLWVLSCQADYESKALTREQPSLCQCDQYGSQAYSYRQENDLFTGMWSSESTETVHVLKFNEFDWML